MKKYKALFHVDEVGKINLALGNMRNVFDDLGEDQLEIAFVGNSEGLALMYKESEYKERVEELFDRGATFAACANTMKAKNLTKDDLLDFVYIVPSGVGEIVKKQFEGFAYVRP